jgi:flagella basal body P-ring formation protein FlgA
MKKTVNQNTVYRKPRKHLRRGKQSASQSIETVQKGPRLRRKLMSLVYALIPGFIVICLMLSSASAAPSQWDAEEVLESYLIANYPWNDIQVSKVRFKGKLGDEAPEYINVEKGPIGKGVFSFLFKDERRVIVTANINAFGQVIKSMRPYRKGRVIRSDDLYVSKMDIRKMPGSAIKDPASVIGKSLKRSISANIPIVENMVESSQVVKRGKRVLLIISQSGLNITAYGQIKEKGYVGMPVKAMNLSSKKDVMGVLVDENTVEVEL